MNIQQIATLAGVSKSTVSRYINHSSYVSKTTAAKIESAMNKVDFVPNEIARNLSLGKTNLIGVMYPFQGTIAYDQIIKGINTAATEKKAAIVLFETNYLVTKEQQVLEQLKKHVIDSLIIISRSTAWETIEQYWERGNIVALEQNASRYISFVTPNRWEAAADILRWAKTNQITRLGITVGRYHPNSNGTMSMINAYQQLTSDKTFTNIVTNCFTFEDGLRAAAHFIQQKPAIEAIWSNDDEIAAGILFYYRQKQVKPPLLIGQNNLPIGKFAGIHTIDFSLTDHGKKAVELLGTTQKEQLFIDHTFIKRQTTL